MAKVSYVPVSDIFEQLFAFCGVTLQKYDYSGVPGWDYLEFLAARDSVEDYLNLHYDEDPDAYDEWFDMLDNYAVNYWSVEGVRPSPLG